MLLLFSSVYWLNEYSCSHRSSKRYSCCMPFFTPHLSLFLRITYHNLHKQVTYPIYYVIKFIIYFCGGYWNDIFNWRMDGTIALIAKKKINRKKGEFFFHFYELIFTQLRTIHFRNVIYHYCFVWQMSHLMFDNNKNNKKKPTTTITSCDQPIDMPEGSFRVKAMYSHLT